MNIIFSQLLLLNYLKLLIVHWSFYLAHTNNQVKRLVVFRCIENSECK